MGEYNELQINSSDEKSCLISIYFELALLFAFINVF